MKIFFGIPKIVIFSISTSLIVAAGFAGHLIYVNQHTSNSLGTSQKENIFKTRSHSYIDDKKAVIENPIITTTIENQNNTNTITPLVESITTSPITSPNTTVGTVASVTTTKISITPTIEEKKTTITGLLFYDLNINNIKDTDEPAGSGIIVDLYRINNDGTYTDMSPLIRDYTYATNSIGQYSFKDVPKGKYIITTMNYKEFTDKYEGEFVPHPLSSNTITITGNEDNANGPNFALTPAPKNTKILAGKICVGDILTKTCDNTIDPRSWYAKALIGVFDSNGNLFEEAIFPGEVQGVTNLTYGFTGLPEGNYTIKVLSIISSKISFTGDQTVHVPTWTENTHEANFVSGPSFIITKP